MKLARKIIFAVKMCRVLPVYFMWKHSPNKEIIRQDIECWKERKHMPYKNELVLLGHLLLEAEGFRNLIMFRIHRYRFLMKMLFPPVNTLFIAENAVIGPKLYT